MNGRPQGTSYMTRDEVDHVILATSTLIIDADGARWCMIGGRYGFVRSAGVWWYAVRTPETRLLVEISTESTLHALDEWERRHTPRDADPTPAHGVARPMGVYIGGRLAS